MTVTFEPTDQSREEARRDQLAQRIMRAVLGALDLQAIYLGDRLGLYRALVDGGPATAPELAQRAGIHPRYAREWLEHQAVGAILDVDDVTAPADERRYMLPPGHQAVLIDPESLSLVGPYARFLISSARVMPQLLEAYRTGDGVSWADYGTDNVEAQEATNRPLYSKLMGDWLEVMPDIAARLRTGQGHVADIACGAGWSSIAIARHFPGVEVDGIDADEASIARAKRNAADAGVDGRVTFLSANGASARGEGRYDLVTIFEALHDMARPVEVLTTARRLLAPGGAVLIADDRVAEQFTVPGDERERRSYGFSLTACLPNGLFDKPSVGTGSVLRPAALEALAHEAGFTQVTRIPIESDSFWFYRLDP
jgi:2-polyprenyl-3-methyl-5-hydroxy-6-metoxy-1,4-benzoquinol methylase